MKLHITFQSLPFLTMSHFQESSIFSYCCLFLSPSTLSPLSRIASSTHLTFQLRQKRQIATPFRWGPAGWGKRTIFSPHLRAHHGNNLTVYSSGTFSIGFFTAYIHMSVSHCHLYIDRQYWFSKRRWRAMCLASFLVLLTNFNTS